MSTGSTTKSAAILRTAQRLAITTFFVVSIMAFVYFGWSLRGTTGFYMPMVVAVPSLALGIIAIARDGFRFRRAIRGEEIATDEDSGASWAMAEEEEDAEPAMQEWQAFGIAGLLFVCFWFLGMVGATVVFTFGYMYIIGRERLLLSALVASGTALFVWAFFIELLSAQVYSGYLTRELIPTIMGG